MLVSTHHLRTRPNFQNILTQTVSFCTRRENALNSRVSKSWQKAVKQCEEQDLKYWERFIEEYNKQKSVPAISLMGMGVLKGIVQDKLIFIDGKNLIVRTIQNNALTTLNSFTSRSLNQYAVHLTDTERFRIYVRNYDVADASVFFFFDSNFEKKEYQIDLYLPYMNKEINHKTMECIHVKDKEFFAITNYGFLFHFDLDKGVLSSKRIIPNDCFSISGESMIDGIVRINNVLILKGKTQTGSNTFISFVFTFSIATQTSLLLKKFANEVPEDTLIGIGANSQHVYFATLKGVDAHENKNGQISLTPTYTWAVSSQNGKESGVECVARMPEILPPQYDPIVVTEDFVMVHFELHTNQPYLQKYAILHAHHLKPFRVEKSNRGFPSNFLGKDVVFAMGSHSIQMRHLFDKVTFPDITFDKPISSLHKQQSQNRVNAVAIVTGKGDDRSLKLISLPESAKKPPQPKTPLPKGKQVPSPARRWKILLLPAKLYELFKRFIESLIHCMQCKKNIKKV